MTPISEGLPDPETYVIFPRIMSVFFYFLASLVILADIRALLRYTRVMAKVVDIEKREEVMHDMGGASHTEHIPEIEFQTTDMETVRMKIYETLLKSLSPGHSLTVYYRKSEKDDEYRLYFPFSRSKFILISLFMLAGFFLWEASGW
jgi:hypothetical protein